MLEPLYQALKPHRTYLLLLISQQHMIVLFGVMELSELGKVLGMA